MAKRKFIKKDEGKNSATDLKAKADEGKEKKSTRSAKEIRGAMYGSKE